MKLKGLFEDCYVEVKDASAWGGGYAVGFLYQPTDKLKIGIAYTAESMLEDFDADEGYAQIAGQPAQQYPTKVKDFQLPQKVGIGISYQFTPKFLVGFDAEWQDYSHAFRRIVIDMKGFGEPTCDLKWKDSYHFAIGAEYKLTPRFTLRTGYAYTGENVTPDEGAFPYIPSTTGDSHNLTAGFGYSFKNYLIDFGWSHHLDVQDRTGPSRIGADYENSTLGFGDNLYVISFTYLYN
jgi:long-chain fatty acid transport protein